MYHIWAYSVSCKVEPRILHPTITVKKAILKSPDRAADPHGPDRDRLRQLRAKLRECFGELLRHYQKLQGTEAETSMLGGSRFIAKSARPSDRFKWNAKRRLG